MTRLSITFLAFVVLGASSVRADEGSAVETVVVPFVTKHCLSCHGTEKKKADLSLASYKDEASILKARKVWKNVLDQLHAGEMPPLGRPRPTPAESEAFAKAVAGVFQRHDRTTRDPGRVTMRRLNRVEYQNTIRDLVGVDIPIGEDFPSDDVGHGFDNIGDVLTISPLHMERYLAAAETIMNAAIVVGVPPKPPVQTVAGRNLKPNLLPLDKPAPLFTKGPLSADFHLKQAGDCKIVVRFWAQQAGDEPLEVAVLHNGERIHTWTVSDNRRGIGKNRTIELKLKPGEHRVGLSVLNPYTDPKDDKRRGIFIEFVQLVGPLDTRPDSHVMLLSAPDDLDEAARTRHVLSRFATRAYRRPATSNEVDRLAAIVREARDDGESWEGAVSLAMQAVLVSPKFLFRVELDSRPEGDSPRTLDDYSLASRLSYFLWSTMPDAELFDVAARGRMHADLVPQVRRMLKDRRSSALIDNFAGQWLQLRPLRTATPDPERFPEFDDRLRADMLKETDLFLRAVRAEDRSVLDLIDGRFTYMNERLAKHYGIRDTNGNPASGPPLRPAGRPILGSGFVRVNLEGTPRGGLLTQASVLTVTSNPTRTSPVKRGRWVLEQILGTPPPPPPPNVPELEEAAGGQTKGSLRQRMEQHRANPACAGCHARMDPIGFAFENFDAVGKFRVKDGATTIDPAGELPGGQKFRGPDELKAILKGKKELFGRCLAEKMLTYALGRGIEFYDAPAIDAIVGELEENDYRFSALIAAIATSDPFRLRRGKE